MSSNHQVDALAAAGFVSHPQHHTEATPISLRFWARAIGDRNRRFVDESYAPEGASRFVAHPCWLYSVNDTAASVGAADEVPIIAGTRWHFMRPVVVGERITSTSRLVAEREVHSRHAGRARLQTIAVEYLDRHAQPVATARATLLRVSPERAREFGTAGKYAQWQRWKYTPAELAGIEHGYDLEQARNSTPLGHEDVRVGDELPPIVRGPVTSEEMVLFVGATRPVRPISAFMAERAAGRAAAFIHPRTGTWEDYAAGMIDDESARQCGYPAAHDYGIDRISQMASMVANWCGDHGRIVGLDARLLEPCMLGDATWFRGRVSAVAAAGARSGLATIEAWGTNQRGQVSVRGTLGVELPLRCPAWARPDAA